MTNISTEFIQKIPKYDLHLHLDGSLRLSTLIELAKKETVELPSYEEEGLKETVFKSHYENLGEYLQGFAYTVAVLKKEEHLERTAFELAEDAYREGVRYIEVRFAPQLHVAHLQEIEKVTRAVIRGLNAAKKQFNQSVGPNDMPFEFGIILCALRRFTKHMSPYYENMHTHGIPTNVRYIHARASAALAKEAVRLRNEGLPVVGFDLAGEEAGYPAVHHKAAFQYAHRHFLRKTVHAGEAYGPESIFQAITECYANRIGHGTFLFSEEAIQLHSIRDKRTYVEQLSEYIANQRIALEVCLTSNLQTTPNIKCIEEHPVKQMIDRNLAVTINTDNRLISHTNSTNELTLLTQHLDLKPHQFRNIILAGFKAGFFPASYDEKRKYVRRAIRLYDKLAEQFQ